MLLPALTSCTDPGTPEAAASGASRPPSAAPSTCPVAQVAALGRPGVSRLPSLATFRTDGGKILVSASGFPHGAPFDPKVGSTLVYVGDAGTRPTYDAQHNVVTHATSTIQVYENQRAVLHLRPGRYWLVSSNIVTITLEACRTGTISDVLPNP